MTTDKQMPNEHSGSNEVKPSLQKRRSKRLAMRVRLIRRRLASSRVRLLPVIALAFAFLLQAIVDGQSAKDGFDPGTNGIVLTLAVELLSAFPEEMSADQFVNRLDLNSGSVLSAEKKAG